MTLYMDTGLGNQIKRVILSIESRRNEVPILNSVAMIAPYMFHGLIGQFNAYL